MREGAWWRGRVLLASAVLRSAVPCAWWPGAAALLWALLHPGLLPAGVVPGACYHCPQGLVYTAATLLLVRLLRITSQSSGADVMCWRQLARILTHSALPFRFTHIPLVASLAGGLSQFRDSLGVALVDAVLEDIR